MVAGVHYQSTDYYCPMCNSDYTFNWNTFVCVECSTGIPNCNLCEGDGTCLECADGYFISLDGG